jgi:hypothetical protein
LLQVPKSPQSSVQTGDDDEDDDDNTMWRLEDEDDEW